MSREFLRCCTPNSNGLKPRAFPIIAEPGARPRRWLTTCSCRSGAIGTDSLPPRTTSSPMATGSSCWEPIPEPLRRRGNQCAPPSPTSGGCATASWRASTCTPTPRWSRPRYALHPPPDDGRRGHIAELRKRVAEAEATRPILRSRIGSRNGPLIRDQAHEDAEWAAATGRTCWAPQVEKRGWTYWRDHLRAVAQRIEVVSPSEIRNPWHERTATDTCNCCERRNGGFWRSQFYTKVARPERFE